MAMVDLPFFSSCDNVSGAVSRIDPRSRLFALAVLVVLISVTLDCYSYLLFSALIIFLLLSLKVKIARLRKTLPPFLLLILVTFVLHLLFNRSTDDSVITLFGLSFSKYGVVQGAYYSWRIVLYLLAALLFSYSITHDQFATAVFKLLAPLKKLGIPANDLGLVLFLALRFIPTIFEQYTMISLAQRARGAKFGGGIITRSRQTIPMLIPVVVSAMRKGDVLADCLTVRGWGCADRRTFYHDDKISRIDILVVVLSIFLIVVIIGINR